MIVSSRKLIKSKNLIEVDSEKRFITNEERDFLILLFNKHFNGLKIPKSLGSELHIIRYVLMYILENYGLPNNRYGKQYKTQITEDKSITIIGI